MKYLYVIVIMFWWGVSANAQTPEWEWEKSIGMPAFENGVTMAIATDSFGNSYVTGAANNNLLIFGNDTVINTDTFLEVDNFFVIKYDAAGNVIWAEGAIGCAAGAGVNFDSKGNIYITGTFYGDSISFGGFTLYNPSTFYNPQSAANGSPDIFIVKYDSSGNVLWAKCGKGYGSGYAIKADAKGNSCVTGCFSSATITFDSLTLTNAGSNTDNVLIIKLDPLGNLIWGKTVGGTDSYDSRGTSIDIDNSNNIYLTGYFFGADIAFDSIDLIKADMPSEHLAGDKKPPIFEA